MAMFKKFNRKEDVSSHAQARTSEMRNIRKKIVEMYPLLEKEIDLIFPKKTPIYVFKCKNYVNLVVCNKIVWFFQDRDGPFLPTLRTLHKYPTMLPQLGVDTGAIKFVMTGVPIMCPGLTSAGGKCDIELKAAAYCAIMAEGKEHALAIGRTRISTADIRRVNKDVGVDTVHYLSDALWQIPTMDI